MGADRRMQEIVSLSSEITFFTVSIGGGGGRVG